MRERVKLPVRSVVFPLILSITVLAQTPQTAPPATPASTSTQTQTPNPATAPPPPLPPDEYKNLSDISIELFYWMDNSHAYMRPGAQNVDGDSATLGSGLAFGGKSKAAEGIVVTTPAGRANQLEFTYFRVKQDGNETSPIALILFGQPFQPGDVFGSLTNIQHVKLTWNYLTYPDPPGVHKFRFRTIYGIQYTWMTARFDAPADLYASPIEGTRSLIFPSLGAGVEYHISKHLFFEAKATGFAWPHKAMQGDGEAKLSLRVFRQMDIEVGGREFYFRTNPQKDYYLRANLWGPYAGVRWTFK